MFKILHIPTAKYLVPDFYNRFTSIDSAIRVIESHTFYFDFEHEPSFCNTVILSGYPKYPIGKHELMIVDIEKDV